jgi:ribulose-phosphate 3-epimerase
MIKISASTHPAQKHYMPYVNEVIEAGVDMIHCDVMDGVFVKNTAFSEKEVANINNNSSIVLDVHLMVQHPKKQIKKYKKAGADIVTVHYEAFSTKRALYATIKKIKQYGMMCGISIKPSTPVKEITMLLNKIDLVLVMSVEPGESGQVFLPESLQKMKQLKEEIVKNNHSVLIEVDGGVNLQNKDAIINAGADIVVVGSALFKSKNKTEFIKKIKA